MLLVFWLKHWFLVVRVHQFKVSLCLRTKGCKRMAQEQTQSLDITTRKIRHESGRRTVWHYCCNHQLHPQHGERGSDLGIAKSMGIGRRCWRVILYIHGHKKIMTEMTFSLPSTTSLLQFQPCSKRWMPTLCHAVYCSGCKSHSIPVFEVEAKARGQIPRDTLSKLVSTFCSSLSCLLTKLILSCHFLAHSIGTFWNCSIAKSFLFLSLLMLSLDNLENK